MTTDSVFICYSNKDSEKANEIAITLKNAGVNIWIDTINGKDDDQIQEAIKAAKLFLVITSNNALTDQTLKQEKDFARANDVERLLVKIGSCDTNDKMRWNTLPCVDYAANKDIAIQTILSKLNINNLQKEIDRPEQEVISKSSDDDVENKNSTKDVKPEPQLTSVKDKAAKINNEELLNELEEGFDFYRFKINNQIRNSYYGLAALVAVSVVLLVGLYFWDGLQEFMEQGQEKLKYLGTVGGLIPSTLSTFSVSKIKEKKKRRDGIEDFERILSRMKKGLIPNTKQDILALEDDFIRYTK